ncbi:MAG TPA: PhzF family phenazine biosynthesis protein, partial [Pyrinomonadaceae bacterium]|nr:PhzF family phenazine biosynthesis protein [Pyrinomonadaceae bacterium]
LSDERMLAITREFNHSETTFVLAPRNVKAAWRLRSFTLAEEVFGAGHQTLGAWWAIAENNLIDLRTGTNVIYQEIGDGILPLEIYVEAGKPQRVLMTQSKPVFGESFGDKAKLAETLSLHESDLSVASLEPQAVSTGAFHFLVPVKNIEALKKVRVDAAKLIELARPLGCHGCYLYTLETVNGNSAAHARAFFPGIGMNSEDPATGTAAGPLAAYLVSKGVLSADKTLIIEQGYEINRPSLIEVSVNGDEIKVGGKCVIVGEGNLRL